MILNWRSLFTQPTHYKVTVSAPLGDEVDAHSLVKTIHDVVRNTTNRLRNISLPSDEGPQYEYGFADEDSPKLRRAVLGPHQQLKYLTTEQKELCEERSPERVYVSYTVALTPPATIEAFTARLQEHAALNECMITSEVYREYQHKAAIQKVDRSAHERG